jgi:hypothetical protein
LANRVSDRLTESDRQGTRARVCVGVGVRVGVGEREKKIKF